MKQQKHIPQRGNILGRRGDMNATVNGKLEFLTAVVTNIQFACFIMS